MNEKNMTALVSCFVKCYHYKFNKYRIFSDDIALKLITEEEYNSIKYNNKIIAPKSVLLFSYKEVVNGSLQFCKAVFY